MEMGDIEGLHEMIKADTACLVRDCQEGRLPDRMVSELVRATAEWGMADFVLPLYDTVWVSKEDRLHVVLSAVLHKQGTLLRSVFKVHESSHNIVRDHCADIEARLTGRHDLIWWLFDLVDSEGHHPQSR